MVKLGSVWSRQSWLHWAQSDGTFAMHTFGETAYRYTQEVFFLLVKLRTGTLKRCFSYDTMYCTSPRTEIPSGREPRLLTVHMLVKTRTGANFTNFTNHAAMTVYSRAVGARRVEACWRASSDWQYSQLLSPGGFLGKKRKRPEASDSARCPRGSHG